MNEFIMYLENILIMQSPGKVLTVGLLLEYINQATEQRDRDEKELLDAMDTGF